MKRRRLVVLWILGLLFLAYFFRGPLFFTLEVLSFFGPALADPEIFAWLGGCFFIFIMLPIAIFAYFRWDHSKQRKPDDWRKIR